MTFNASSIAKQNYRNYDSLDSVEHFSDYRLTTVEKYLFRKWYRPGDHILDLACGAGRTTLALHEMGIRVLGLDLSGLMVSGARQRFPYLPFGRADFSRIPLRNSTFDYVLISFNGLDYAGREAERVEAIRESHRALKPGGTFIFSSHNQVVPFLSRIHPGKGRVAPQTAEHVRGIQRKSIRARLAILRIPRLPRIHEGAS